MSTARANGRSLTARLFAIFFIAVFLSFVVATSIAAYVSWTVYEGDAEDRLVLQLESLGKRIEGDTTENMTAFLSNENLADARITLIGSDGTVLFDSFADIATMENHAGREEIQSAQELGESTVMRKSETTGTDMLYVAARLGDDGTVLRLAESRASLADYLSRLLGPLSLAVLVAALLAAALARFTTRRITAPLLDVNLDAPLEGKTYREVRPLLDRIDVQRAELLEQNEQLERAVQMRREFTGNVSHEMKSPLQVIGGYAELIENGIASPDDTKRFAGLIRSESQSMRNLIDDVLTLSRLDEDACDLIQPIDISSVASRVSQRLAHAAAVKGISVQLSVDDEVLVLGSDSLAEQAVYNLVDNAIKHGGSRVMVSTSTCNGFARLEVSDDGPGVPEDQRDRVFERFFRIDPSRNRNTGGTGLGLAIAKHAANSMNGTISVTDSDLGGALFILELPAA